MFKRICFEVFLTFLNNVNTTEIGWIIPIKSGGVYAWVNETTDTNQSKIHYFLTKESGTSVKAGRLEDLKYLTGMCYIENRLFQVFEATTINGSWE